MITYSNCNEDLDVIVSDEAELYVAADQVWDYNTIEELKNKYRVFFQTNPEDDAHIAFKYADEQTIAIGYEDDGTIYFDVDEKGNYKHTFSTYWLNSILSDLSCLKKNIIL